MHVVSDCLAGVDDDLTNSCSSNTIHVLQTCESFTCCRTHTHTRLTALCPGLPGWAGTRKVKPIWILLKQETVSGSGISWAICKCASRSRQITTPAPHCSVLQTGCPSCRPTNRPTESKHCCHEQLALLMVILVSMDIDVQSVGRCTCTVLPPVK